MSLLDFDQSIFLWINKDLSNTLFDVILPMIRSPYIWIPVYVFIIGFVFFNFNKKNALGLIISMMMTVALADMVSSKLIKKNVQRLRPCQTEEIATIMIERVVCGSGFSFTSSHATNHFALCFFLINTVGMIFKKWILPLIIWASLISFAQIYVGLHYPFDVFFGAILGLVVGSVLAELFKRTSFYRSA